MDLIHNQRYFLIRNNNDFPLIGVLIINEIIDA